jgi:hypothetical protein
MGKISSPTWSTIVSAEGGSGKDNLCFTPPHMAALFIGCSLNDFTLSSPVEMCELSELSELSLLLDRFFVGCFLKCRIVV